MGKQSFIVLLMCFACMFLCSPSMGFAQSSGQIIFCKSIDEKIQPVDPSETFNTNIISWVSRSVKPYGKPTLVLSIYEKNDAREKLIIRQEMQVRPTWQVSAMRNLSLPSEGTFLVTLDLPDGTSLSSGTVTVTKMQKTQDEPAPEMEVLGDTATELFNKYKPTNN